MSYIVICHLENSFASFAFRKLQYYSRQFLFVIDLNKESSLVVTTDWGRILICNVQPYQGHFLTFNSWFSVGVKLLLKLTFTSSAKPVISAKTLVRSPEASRDKETELAPVRTKKRTDNRQLRYSRSVSVKMKFYSLVNICKVVLEN